MRESSRFLRTALHLRAAVGISFEWMGISGLLGKLSSVQRDVHVSQYENLSVGIDAYCWLHKASYACSTELCLNKAAPALVSYFMTRIRLLKSYNVNPLVVFDGGYLPQKAQKEQERETKRRDSLKKALELTRQENHSAARNFFMKAVDITPEIALRVIAELRKEGVPFQVAPYEADAQLAFLYKEDIISAVISEDSDLLVYGIGRVLFKMDKTGTGKEIRLEDIGKSKEMDLRDFSHEMFQVMCILSGCDYVSSLKGMGLKTAYNIVRKHRSVRKLFRKLRLDGGYDGLKAYHAEFIKALCTFRHQTVFDPSSRKLTAITEFGEHAEELEDVEFLGKRYDDHHAYQVFKGELNPITLQPFPRERARGNIVSDIVQMNCVSPFKSSTSTLRYNFSEHQPTESIHRTVLSGRDKRDEVEGGARDVSSNVAPRRSRFVHEGGVSLRRRFDNPTAPKLKLERAPKKSRKLTSEQRGGELDTYFDSFMYQKTESENVASDGPAEAIAELCRGINSDISILELIRQKDKNAFYKYCSSEGEDC